MLSLPLASIFNILSLIVSGYNWADHRLCLPREYPSMVPVEPGDVYRSALLITHTKTPLPSGQFDR
jgi:hypothetical protein